MEETGHNSVMTQEKHFGVATPLLLWLPQLLCTCEEGDRKKSRRPCPGRMSELGPSVSGVDQSHLKLTTVEQVKP